MSISNMTSTNMHNSNGATKRNSSAGPNVYKVVVMGPGGCGKSAISISFVSAQFVDSYGTPIRLPLLRHDEHMWLIVFFIFTDPTIEDSYRRQLRIDDRACVLDILDTAGQEEYGAMRDQYMRTGEGFLLVYDVTQRASFDEMRLVRDQIERVTDQEKMAIVIAGNKCDLPEHMHQVSEEEGRAVAEAMGARFLLTSAKQRMNIDEVFIELVHQIDIRRGDANEADKKTSSSTGKFKGAKAKLLQKKCSLF